MWLAVRLLCPHPGAVAFTRVYAYFRWADDIVDAPGRDAATVNAFVADQAALIAGRRPPAEPPEAALLAALADPALGAALRPVVDGMWRALAFDATRGPAPLPAAALDAQVARIGDAYLAAMWTCSGAAGTPPAALFELSRAATLTHVLRDLPEDLALGYLNAPPDVTDDATRAAWVRARGAEAAARFAAGAQALPGVRPWRTRWLVRLVAWKYRRTLAAVLRAAG